MCPRVMSGKSKSWKNHATIRLEIAPRLSNSPEKFPERTSHVINIKIKVIKNEIMENLGVLSGTAGGLLPLELYWVNSGLLERVSQQVVTECQSVMLCCINCQRCKYHETYHKVLTWSPFFWMFYPHPRIRPCALPVSDGGDRRL